jgi:tetratricopeptide (TPR) repeat protein
MGGFHREREGWRVRPVVTHLCECPGAVTDLGAFCYSIVPTSSCCEQALALHRRSGDRPGQASTLDSLGYTHHLLGHHPQAVACFQQALDMFGDIGDRYEQAATLDHLGDTQDAAGDPAAARAAWQRSLDILDELDHPGARDVRAKLRDSAPALT